MSAGIVWTQLALLKAIDGEEDDQRHETDVAPALGSYDAEAFSTSGWSDAEGALWTLGMNSATGGRVATVSTADAVADAVVEAAWAVTLATTMYDPGGSSDTGIVVDAPWRRPATTDGPDQLMDTGAISTND